MEETGFLLGNKECFRGTMQSYVHFNDQANLIQTGL